MSILLRYDMTPEEAVASVISAIYEDGLHDCCGLDEFDPDDCPNCLKCGHCSVRHQDLPVGRGVCDAPGCECFHLTTGDDCEECSGTGTLTDPQDRDYECRFCRGEGVIA
jgi:hypothetical protein